PQLRGRLHAREAADSIDWSAARPAKWAWLRQLHGRGLVLRADLQADFAAFAAAPPAEVAAYVALAAGNDAVVAQLHLFGQWLASRAPARFPGRARTPGLGLAL